MCLELSDKSYFKPKWYNKNPKPTPLIAKEDIICYKVYKRGSYSDLLSVFRNTPHNYGIQPRVNFTFSANYGINFSEFNGVESGYHSCMNIIQAKYIQNKKNKEIIVKCIIPKGAKYFIGWFNFKEGYASNELIIVEECV